MELSPVAQRYRQELRERILPMARQQFREKGIRAVKMDDLAHSLSISKRTLYEIYADKEELLIEVMKFDEEQRKAYMADIVARENATVMDVILAFYHRQMEDIAHINPLFYEEVPRYRRLMDYLESTHQEREQRAQEFFQRGVKEGFFREDFDYGLISLMGGAVMEHVMRNKLYETYSVKHLFHNVIMLYMRGFCTPKGVDVIDRMLKE